MDDIKTAANIESKAMEPAQQTRDENRSPTSGSSSETPGEEKHYRKDAHRKHRRPPQRKRKWKPYTDLSWDERKKQDDRESRRAFAKRERLSAEGHPIAPYNTTQFLMEDDHRSSPNQEVNKKIVTTESSVSLQSMDAEMTPTKAANVVTDDAVVLELRRARFCVDSPHPDNQNQSERGSETRDDIQRYILNDFSHTYAGIHAEELQSMSKVDLIAECLKLEKKVDLLERRVKRCKEKHRDEPRNQADVRLLEKINQLQGVNSKLQKENASILNRNQDQSALLDDTSKYGAHQDAEPKDA